MLLKGKNKNSVFKILRFLLLAICILILTVYIIASPEVSVQTLLSHTPQNPVAAAAVLLALYAFKSATAFIPLILLEIVTGHLFSPGTALLINFMGMIITLTVPYWIGKAAGIESIQKLVKKYPRFGSLIGKQQDNAFFLCFFLRIISFLPGDVVTMYLGATRTPFWKNLLAGALGVLPGMILATFMGSSIQEPGSPAFWISTILMLVLAALSVLLYYAYRRKMKKKTVANEQRSKPTP